ncbi:hypothetical protein AMJ47_03955 [Parcubacteria bacterium DG_72]|nr:MAG: hypothetical protein AMJ47_03955 [Parcubacteria bacterium DG_72]
MKVSFKRNYFWVFLVIIILAVALTNVFQKQVRGFFYWFSAPVQESLWEAGHNASNFSEGVFNFASLNNKIQELEQKNQGLIAEIIKLKELEEENKTLRQALDIELQKEYNLSVAKIISKDPSQDFILINKGSKDNILENMAVITENKVLVGITKQVYNNYSKVMLPSHKDISFDVKIKQEEKEISAVAQGQGNLEIILTLIPHEEEIFQGDIVITSSLSGIFPESLLIGEIKSVAKNDIDPFQTAKIENALEVFELNNVFIIND